MSFPASMFEPFLTSVYIVTHWGKHVLKIFTLKKFMKREQATFAVLSTNLFSVKKRNVSSKTSYTKKIHVLILPLKLCRFQLDNWTALKKILHISAFSESICECFPQWYACGIFVWELAVFFFEMTNTCSWLLWGNNFSFFFLFEIWTMKWS